MRRSLILVPLMLMVATSAAIPAAATTFLSSIPLPVGYQPEGVATQGSTAFVGSLADGDVVTVDLHSGDVTHLVDNQSDDGRVAVGLAADRGLVIVAGGPTGHGYVYDAATGDEVADLTLTTAESTFVNDVVVSGGSAWFTDSMQPQLYRVPLTPTAIGVVETVPLTGPASEFVPGFNINGIESIGGELIVVNSTLGALFAVTPDGGSRAIDLGGASVTNGDGLVLRGRDLYVVRNQLHQVDVVRLSADLSSGTAVGSITSDLFDVPTTAAFHGNRLVLVNARFGIPDPASATYNLVQVAID